jgi:hypothetical protein
VEADKEQFLDDPAYFRSASRIAETMSKVIPQSSP